MDLVGRLKVYMQHVGLPISQFADFAQIPRPTLSQILSGRNKKISNELMEKLHAAFPALNINWLLFGDGPIENAGHASAPSPQPVPKPQPQVQSIPIPPITNPRMDEIEMELDNLDEAEDKSVEGAPSQPLAISPDASKRIQTIIVFYSDNSFEIFTPSQR
ncbi:MAG: helix-turn-helix domain-containing protein [Bacteroidales bacterium]|nr:helix-turn-helix domain-containing protein [Bacteroidales bacterium]